jgi:hypothetical protein
MGYLYTGSTQSAATNTGLSTQIIVKVDGQAVGAIQSLQATQSRPIKTVTEIGTDGVIEKVPSGPVDVKLQITRMVFDRRRLPEAFQRGYLNIHAQRIPFDIFIFDFSNVSPDNVDDDFDASGQQDVITTIYENCWFNNLAVNYQTADYTITETANVDVEFVHTFVNGDPKQNASVGNPDFDDALERLADTGRRGSLDGRGLAQVNDIFGVFTG